MKLRYAILIFALSAFLVAGCSAEKTGTDVYVMEELEAASSIDNPQRRVEHLKMFAASYPDRYCRKFAYLKIFETLTAELGREEEGFDFIRDIEQKDDDAGITGELRYAGFSYLMDVDSSRAVRYADDILNEPETSFRIYLYFGFDLDRAGRPGLAIRMFRKGLSRAENSVERSFAGMILGEALIRNGDEEGGMELLEESEVNPFTGKYAGDILWERGDREEAIDDYIRLVAGVPGMREVVKLDSLYNLVYPERPLELDREILRRRTGEKKLLHDAEFTDIRGKVHRLSEYRGGKLVISAWSPD